MDLTKISHNVHRIGYHFHVEVIQQACADLDYTLSTNGNFISRQEARRQRYIEELLRKHSGSSGPLRLNSEQESLEQVSAAIKELFPRIPDEDLVGVVKHAWSPGTGRVGQSDLDLPRRVQLAVGARIRHNYTDYDRLLSAFGWHDARAMTEQPSLEKLIEWRGDQPDDEQEMEEILREIIVIDDDDEDTAGAAANGSEADDEDSTAEQDHSDTRIEVTQHLPDDTDIGGESTFEEQQPSLRRKLPRGGNFVRQEIATPRQQIQFGAAALPSSSYVIPPPASRRLTYGRQ